jgi:hypothetical protein
MNAIAAGTVFDTPFERGLVALEGPDELGWFAALDSDRVRVNCSGRVVETTESDAGGYMPLVVTGTLTAAELAAELELEARSSS